ncbi:2-deoxy-D-gluconate 3-dehydrogenase, partial [Acinetobacter baumannii]|nr:2-deoxy-D-gluconate 3-dehydrogenase [Acinetobacter baumannii]
MFDITGKRVLITGASSGFGAHFARALAERGAD